MTTKTQVQPIPVTLPAHAADAANTRTFPPWIIGGGLVALIICWPVGLALIVIGAYFMPATAAVDAVVAEALTEAEQGGGGGWLALAVLLILGFGLLGLALLGAAVEGGVITP
jgi:hypothetical protein